MNNSKHLERVYLSIYSFGYSAGFIKDERKLPSSFEYLTPIKVAEIALKNGLGGIEIPVDKYFPDPKKDGLEEFIEAISDMGLKLIFDLENFSKEYLELLGPFLLNYGASFLRVKISGFYGGNRYKNPSYITDRETFINNLDNSIEILQKNKFKILIENHQDVVLADIEELISKYGEDKIGVNWDIGNSFPTCETPESFYKRIAKHIGNVHLKDYKLFQCDEGYIMSRCSLGKGVVDFPSIIRELINKENIPLTIELGAMNSRIADINIPEYWEHSKGVSYDDKVKLMSFIKNNAIVSNDWKSAWELGLSPDEIIYNEEIEFQESVNYIKEIIREINSEKNIL